MPDDKVTVYSFFGESYGPVYKYDAADFLRKGLKSWENILGFNFVPDDHSGSKFAETYPDLMEMYNNLQLPFFSDSLGRYIQTAYSDYPSSESDIKVRLSEAQRAWRGELIANEPLRSILEDLKRAAPPEIWGNNSERVVQAARNEQTDYPKKGPRKDSLSGEIKSLRDEIEALKKQLDPETEQSKDRIESAARAHIDDFDEKLAEAQANAVTAIATGEPAAYWQTRVDEANERAKRVAWLFLATISAAAGSAAYLSYWTTRRIGTDSPDLISGLGYYLAPLAIGALGFWILRLIARQYLAARHMAHDAGERLVIIKTFLALLQEPGAINDEARQIFIAAVARKSGDGLITDDAAPLFENLIQKVSP